VRRPAALAVVAACFVLGLTGPAWAVDGPTLAGRLSAAMRSAGPYSGAYVRDLDTGQRLFALRENLARAPASVEKLYTTATALLRYGPAGQLQTAVLGAGTLDPAGTWHGDLYLKGGGDPTFAAPGVAALATALAQQTGIVRVDGSVVGDESYFDQLRGSARTGFRYDPDVEGVLSALAFSRGRSPDGEPAEFAARRLAAALRADGVAVLGPTHTGLTPDGAVPLASVPSPPLRQLVRMTNVPSDNYFAEMLLKDLGAQFGAGGSTPDGVAVVRAQLATFGIHPRIVDGSGLSRADRTTPRQVVRLLERMHGQEVAPDFEASLPVAGRTGTLHKRMRGTAAQGACRAKTGTLIGVSSLAGLCLAADGHTVAFAFLMNGVNVYAARRLQDRMTEALARYDG